MSTEPSVLTVWSTAAPPVAITGSAGVVLLRSFLASKLVTAVVTSATSVPLIVPIKLPSNTAVPGPAFTSFAGPSPRNLVGCIGRRPTDACRSPLTNTTLLHHATVPPLCNATQSRHHPRPPHPDRPPNALH